MQGPGRLSRMGGELSPCVMLPVSLPAACMCWHNHAIVRHRILEEALTTRQYSEGKLPSTSLHLLKHLDL